MTGTQFEKAFCRELFNNGYWALNIPRSQNGSQPFDVIAVRGEKIVAVDCKVCSTPRFSLSRIEDNQWSAFEMLSARAPNAVVGIVCWCDALYFAPFRVLLDCAENGLASISLDKNLRFNAYYHIMRRENDEAVREQ